MFPRNSPADLTNVLDMLYIWSCVPHSIPVPAGVVHQLVHSYLLHYGYAETLTAFDQAAGLAGMEQPMG